MEGRGGEGVALTDSKPLSSAELRAQRVNEAAHERQFLLDVIAHRLVQAETWI